MLPFTAVVTVVVTDGLTAASARFAAAALTSFSWMTRDTIASNSKIENRLAHKIDRLRYQGGGADN